MARTRKISSHPILDPEISGRTGEATPRGTVQSLPTSSKESHNDAKHVISLANNMDAHTMIARTVRKRQRVLSDKDNSTSKRLRKSHRRHKPSPLEAAASSTIPIGANILSLPLELHQQILSYTSAKDAARLRGVCKGLKAVIMKSSAHLVKLYTRKELSRLQGSVNDFEGLKIPTDVDSPLEAVHIWTGRRCFFSHLNVSQGSMSKLMAHFLLKDNTDDPIWSVEDAVEWSFIAAEAAYMMSNPLTNSGIEAQFSRLTTRTDKLDYSALDKLLEYSARPQSQATNHRLGGRTWPEEMMEHMTFPSMCKLTPLLRTPSTHGIEFFGFDGAWPFDEGTFELWWDYVDKPGSAIQILQPEIGNERLVRYLELPDLSSTVSCYYVSDSWARKQIDELVYRLDNGEHRQKKKVLVAPLLRAAILEHVKYF